MLSNYQKGWIKRKERSLGIPWNKGLSYKKDVSKLTGKFLHCLICGKEFYCPKSRIDRGQAKYCSFICAGKARIGTENFHNIDKGHTVTYKCEECGKEKTIKLAVYRKAKNHFCSVQCKNIWQSKNKKGQNHWNWKGGISEKDKLLRRTPEYNQWRLLVYKRDYYTCQKCGHKHINLIAHHIKTFAEFEDLRFKIDNGVTVCRSCHKKIHKEIGITTRFSNKIKIS